MSYDGVMQIGARYDAVCRYKLISEVKKLRQALIDYKYKENSKKRQLECMEILHDLLPEEEKQEKLNYIKINNTVNKATSNVFGFPKMLKKAEMNNEMLNLRDRIMPNIRYRCICCCTRCCLHY